MAVRFEGLDGYDGAEDRMDVAGYGSRYPDTDFIEDEEFGPWSRNGHGTRFSLNEELDRAFTDRPPSPAGWPGMERNGIGEGVHYDNQY